MISENIPIDHQLEEDHNKRLNKINSIICFQTKVEDFQNTLQQMPSTKH